MWSKGLSLLLGCSISLITREGGSKAYSKTLPGFDCFCKGKWKDQPADEIKKTLVSEPLWQDLEQWFPTDKNKVAFQLFSGKKKQNDLPLCLFLLTIDEWVDIYSFITGKQWLILGKKKKILSPACLLYNNSFWMFFFFGHVCNSSRSQTGILYFG